MKKGFINKLKGALASAAAVIMAVGMMGANATPVMAAQGTITITPPSGTESNQTHTYRIYKVFNATYGNGGVSYTLLDGKSTEDRQWTDMAKYFDVDSAGNVTAKEDAKIGGNGSDKDDLNASAIATITKYVDAIHAEPVTSVTTTGTAPQTSGALENGYYYITTTTGSLVTITSTTPSASVNDKNTVPSVTKIIANTGNNGSHTDDGKKAIAQAGNTLTYTATVTFGKGSSNVKFHDKMGTGLAKIVDSEIKVTIAATGGTGATDITAQYPVEIKRGNEADPGDDITIHFADSTPENAVATITYTARVIKSDMTTDDTAGQNTAWVTYGSSEAKTPEEHTQVYNAKITVTKQDGNGAALAGAVFFLKAISGNYYKKNDDGTISWVSNENGATEYTSNDQGAGIVFDGLPNGTYTLIEKTVPAGYNKAENQNITINAASEPDAFTKANLERSETVVNKAGSQLPSTGGIGTTIFYVIGGAVVAGAIVLLIARRRKNA